ncbi:RHS repeat domain-containing protein, partial [Streptomyces sp. NPDC048845]|uniref:RHS repeat domain-containing protein n=1 Tax=Streptomyces sp. NPDC048845 TaxID=3155390 RepID=UPI0034336C17
MTTAVLTSRSSRSSRPAAVGSGAPRARRVRGAGRTGFPVPHGRPPPCAGPGARRPGFFRLPPAGRGGTVAAAGVAHIQPSQRDYDDRGNCTAVTDPTGATTRYT